MNIEMNNKQMVGLLPKESRKVVFFYFSIQVIFLAIVIWKQYKGNIVITFLDVWDVISTFVMLFAIGDLLVRLCNLVHNLMNKQKDPNMSTIQLAKTCFNYNVVSVMVVAICTMYLVMRYVEKKGNILNEVSMYDTVSVCCLCIFSFILFQTTFLFKQNLINTIDISFIKSMKGLDYGTGMAYNFYYGYLKIILPSTGTSSKGILEKMENFEDTHNVTITAKKLFLLIPASSYLPPDLKEISYQWMESAQQLEEEKRDRAGVKSRSYKNNIYKIYPGGRNSTIKPEYVVAEGATPILTFFEVQKHYHPESKIYRKYKKEIILTFYEKLQNLLNDDPDCKDLCELIYYEDYNPDQKSKTNVAKVILARLAELKEIQE